MAEYIDKESLITNIKQRYCKLCELLNKWIYFKKEIA